MRFYAFWKSFEPNYRGMEVNHLPTPPPLFSGSPLFSNFNEARSVEPFAGGPGAMAPGKIWKLGLKWCFFRAIFNILKEILLHVIHFHFSSPCIFPSPSAFSLYPTVLFFPFTFFFPLYFPQPFSTAFYPIFFPYPSVLNSSPPFPFFPSFPNFFLPFFPFSSTFLFFPFLPPFFFHFPFYSSPFPSFLPPFILVFSEIYTPVPFSSLLLNTCLNKKRASEEKLSPNLNLTCFSPEKNE